MNHVPDGGSDPPHAKEQFRGLICPDMSDDRYTQSDSAGGSTGVVRIPIGVYCMGVHIGATRQIRVNRPFCGGDAALYQITLTICLLMSRFLRFQRVFNFANVFFILTTLSK